MHPLGKIGHPGGETSMQTCYFESAVFLCLHNRTTVTEPVPSCHINYVQVELSGSDNALLQLVKARLPAVYKLDALCLKPTLIHTLLEGYTPNNTLQSFRGKNGYTAFQLMLLIFTHLLIGEERPPINAAASVQLLIFSKLWTNTHFSTLLFCSVSRLGGLEDSETSVSLCSRWKLFTISKCPPQRGPEWSSWHFPRRVRALFYEGSLVLSFKIYLQPVWHWDNSIFHLSCIETRADFSVQNGTWINMHLIHDPISKWAVIWARIVNQL